MRAWLLSVAALALAACAPSAADAPITEQWRALELQTTRVELSPERIGALVYRGGLELRADEEIFGGLSGLEVLDDGRLVAISDTGMWFEAELVLDGAGRLAGLRDARVAFMRDEAGDPFADKEAGDAEGLTQLADGRFAVSFEQTQSIRLYDLNRDGPFGAALAGPVLDGVARLPENAGLEALAVDGEGALLVGAEGGEAGTTPLWRAALNAQPPVAPAHSYVLRDGFSLTGMDRLPDGGMVVVERFYAPVVGARARVARFDDDALSGGEPIAAEALALLAPPLPVDNFEAIAAVRMPDGATRLYILSDDNFNRRQRTLLLAFDVAAQ